MYKSYIRNYMCPIEPEKNMKGLVEPSVGGGPGARALSPPLKPGPDHHKTHYNKVNKFAQCH